MANSISFVVLVRVTLHWLISSLIAIDKINTLVCYCNSSYCNTVIFYVFVFHFPL